MSPSKPNANIFGTFLETVSSAPSRSNVDLDQITKLAVDWSRNLDEASKPTAPGPASPRPIEAILRSIAEAEAPLSFVDIVKETRLTIDAAAAAIRDATNAGLVNANSQSGSVSFDLTPMGRELMV